MRKPVVALRPEFGKLDAYLGESAVIDREHPDVRAAHASVMGGSDDPVEQAQAGFRFVRDQVRHSLDTGDARVTLTASEVLRHRTGLCYAKSHLFVALLRLSGIPAGLCYQVLREGDRLVLHGLVAAHLQGSWHRLDVRGNKPGVTAEFDLDHETLAFQVDPSQGEVDLPDLLVDAAPSVVRALRSGDCLQRIELPSGLD